jgi:exodeoxyribonuclease VII large subunit
VSAAAYTVTQLTALIRDALASRPELEDVLLEGEISNLSRPVSGHLYFTLKDAGAGIQCVCWRTTVRAIPFAPENGLTVVAHGAVAVFEQQGRYQLYVDRLEPSGVGALALATEQLKKRLAAEGLFEERLKRPLPLLPRRVVVVTSRSGAAFRDVCTVISRRAPGVDIVLSPATVQGEGAVDTVVRALRRADGVRGAEVILLVRGGGSLEDLMVFNSEAVARAVRTARLPVVTGIGHETDTTVADLAADRRAATPSAAAEMVVPNVGRLRNELAGRMLRLSHATGSAVGRARDRLELGRRRLEAGSPAVRVRGARQELDSRRARLRAALLAEVSQKRRRLDHTGSRLAAQAPAARLAAAQARLAGGLQRLNSAGERLVADRRAGIVRRTAQLQALSPLRTLERGYSITLDHSGAVVVDAGTVAAGDTLRTVLHRGALESTVDGTESAPRRGEQMYDTGIRDDR